MSDESKVWRLKTVAKHLGVSVQTLRAQVRRRRLEVLRTGSATKAGIRLKASAIRELFNMEPGAPITIPDASCDDDAQKKKESERDEKPTA